MLEIIGNSKNIPRLQKHFKKMFAGVASVTLNEDDSQVTGLASKEGEEVSQRKTSLFEETLSLNGWSANCSTPLKISSAHADIFSINLSKCHLLENQF